MTRRRNGNDVPEWMKNRRDDNEPEIVSAVRALGAGWWSCSRHEGHDGWVSFRGRWYAVEVKNPTRKWELTPSEEKFMQFCERNGITCYILETGQDVINMLNDNE